MELCHGWARRVLPLSGTRKYSPVEIRALCKRASPPFWLRVEGKHIPVVGEPCLQLACQVSAAYHDWLAYNAPEDDGFAADMLQRELRIEGHMLEPGSEESDRDDFF
jgi:hypothetical protein